MPKMTHKRLHTKLSKEKHIQTVWWQPFSPPLSQTENGYSVWLQIDTTSNITLISQRLWKTIDQLLLRPIRHVARSASVDCVYITAEFPATIKIVCKTASGNIYIADSRHNLLGLDFIKSMDFLDIPLILFVMQFPGVQLKVLLWSRPMTASSVSLQFSQMTSDTALKLKLHQHSDHLLHLFSNLNDQSSHDRGHMWTLLALLMAVAFW